MQKKDATIEMLKAKLFSNPSALESSPANRGKEWNNLMEQLQEKDRKIAQLAKQLENSTNEVEAWKLAFAETTKT